MKIFNLKFILFAASLSSAVAQEKQTEVSYSIAFGSCGRQNHDLPIFHEVVKKQPDLFIFLGDNIYGDTDDMEVLRSKYQQLGVKPSYQALKRSTEILATWDDHDYGRNDAGKEYPHKEASKQEFLRFFEEPQESERRKRPGIYHSVMKQVNGKTIQILLLDNRTFRDQLIPYDKKVEPKRRSFYRLDYGQHTDASKTFLGEQQWQWLEQELLKPADFRVVASGSQFGIAHNGYEAWANFPHEQKRFLELIRKTKAEHLVFISGDVHYAEISKLDPKDGYPIYDITSSGLSSRWDFATPNKNRIEGPVMDNHFGLLTIRFDGDAPEFTAEIWDIRGNQRIEHTVPLAELVW